MIFHGSSVTYEDRISFLQTLKKQAIFAGTPLAPIFDEALRTLKFSMFSVNPVFSFEGSVNFLQITKAKEVEKKHI